MTKRSVLALLALTSGLAACGPMDGGEGPATAAPQGADHLCVTSSSLPSAKLEGKGVTVCQAPMKQGAWGRQIKAVFYPHADKAGGILAVQSGAYLEDKIKIVSDFSYGFSEATKKPKFAYTVDEDMGHGDIPSFRTQVGWSTDVSGLAKLGFDQQPVVAAKR